MSTTLERKPLTVQGVPTQTRETDYGLMEPWELRNEYVKWQVAQANGVGAARVRLALLELTARKRGIDLAHPEHDD